MVNLKIIHTDKNEINNALANYPTNLKFDFVENRLSYKAGNNYFGNFEILENTGTQKKLEFKFLGGTKMFVMDENARNIESFLSDFFSFKVINFNEKPNDSVEISNGEHNIDAKLC
jgi:hypothetical protein